MKYVCMARSGFLPEFNINAKSVYFNPRFFPTTGSMIYWQVKDDGFHIQPNWKDAKIIWPGKIGKESDDDRVLRLDWGGEWTGTAAGASFLFAPTFSCDTNCEINSERVGTGEGGSGVLCINTETLNFIIPIFEAIQHIDGYSSIWEEYKLWIPN